MFFFEKELKAEEILRKQRINGWGGGKENSRDGPDTNT